MTSITSTGITFPDSTTQTSAVYSFADQQAWTDVTASRATDIIYTNTTSRPIMVAVVLTGTPSSANGVKLFVDSKVVCRFGSNPDSSPLEQSLYGIVPVNSTYYVERHGTTITSWSELR